MAETAAGSSKDAARTKVVIRRLPPTLPEETFWNSVQTWVSENTCLWKRYVKGRPAEGNDGHAIFSRAYVLLSTVEAVADFHRGYDGHVFRSKTGEEFQAVVELSPVQKTPYKAKVKVDARQGTIDTEPDYLSFLESLKSPPEKPVLEVSGPISQPTTTPLLEHLRIHGRPGKGNKGKDKSTTSSSDATARRAIASVNAAAAKRAPNANNGPILVAGKGREVSTVQSGGSAPATDGTPSGGEGKKKRNRNKGKGGGQQSSSEATGGQPSKASNQNARPPRPERPGPTPGEAAAGIMPPLAPQATKTDGEGGGKGGRGGRGGKGRSGKGEGKDRSAKAAVTSILSKNAENDSARGGGAGRGRGRGRGGGAGAGGGGAAPSTNPPAAAFARIDG